MRWATAAARGAGFEEALARCAAEVRDSLGSGSVDLALVFASPHYAGAYDRTYGVVSGGLGGVGTLLGCTGGGVIGGGLEVERLPAVSLTAARLPGVPVEPFRVEDGPLPDLDGPPDAWRWLVGVSAGDRFGDGTAEFVLLVHPFFGGAGALLAGLDYAFPGSRKVWGAASGATMQNPVALFLDGEVLSGGAVRVALSGDVVLETAVAQGCRPIGDLLSVTACKENIVYELDGRPALALQKILAGLDELRGPRCSSGSSWTSSRRSRGQGVS